MLLYILKFSACLAVLLLFYKVFLERESIHVFKRFYLLAVLVFSLIVPSLVFTTYVTANPATAVLVHPIGNSHNGISIPPPPEADILDIAPLLWGVYFLGFVFFGIKFIKNLFQVLKRIRNNPKEKAASFVRVLLTEKFHPHTFFKYIFLNKQKYESREIPKEVLLHEETHARQKHSLDVLFIEVLQILMWFNPLIYFIRKSIKLNHEFLADKAVLKNGVASSTYQNTLLSFMSETHHQSLANAINYSSIKKRFTVMKTQSSRKSIVLRTLLLLPLTAVLLISFSSRDIQHKASETLSEIPDLNVSELNIEIKENLSLWLNDSPVSIETLSAKVLETVSPTALTATILINASADIDIPDWLIQQLHKELGKLGIKTIQINTDAAKINTYNDNRKPIIATHEKEQAGASEKQLKVYGELAKKYNAVAVANRKIPLKDLQTLETIYKLMSPIQKAHAEAFPECPPQNVKSQEGASRKLVAEYNKLAKHYNNMSPQRMNVILKDVERLRYIYGLMSDEQRADAEPFPDFPPLPDPPSPATAPKIAGVSEVHPSPEVAPNLALGNRYITAVKATQAAIPPSPPAPEAAVLAGTTRVPPPPPPKSPIEFAREMAKKNAEFYYNGNKISATKALEILEDSDHISLKAQHDNLKRPRVELSDRPMVIQED